MSSTEQAPNRTGADLPEHRYTAQLAERIELKWQRRWDEEATFEAPNPAGPLADDAAASTAAERQKLYVLDMFPYPSGSGLHVGHPLGYIGTDVYTRFKRMCGFNVLYTMGFDAFGLPAEQRAVETGEHPRVSTEANIANMRRQLRRLGLGHDQRRSISTTDVEFYRWTQWIFLQIFNSWYDTEAGRARPIAELEAELAAGTRALPDGRVWSALSRTEQLRVLDGHRLAYVADAPVNWCPGLGTVVANEEVTADGRSDRGNFPVFKRNMRQWLMRITAYADRLIDDLDTLDWPEPIKIMQRNWIGRSHGARVRFPTPAGDLVVFTTRPDTLFGATFMVVAPEHPIVDALVPDAWPEATVAAWTGGAATPGEAVRAYQRAAQAKSSVARQEVNREKSGVFTGSFATNPVNGAQIPIFIADYVLMDYGTGAIMAVPAQDERDWEFAEQFELPIVRTVRPPEGWEGKAFVGDGPAMNSAFLDGLGVDDAKAAMIAWLEEQGCGEGTITYKLRDWLFSRQRYWGEPFPIVYGDDGVARAVPDSMLPVELPDTDQFSPRTFDADDEFSNPESPLDRLGDWVEVRLDLGDGAGPQTYRRDTNVMPQWAGSCWYELRYLDPTNDQRFVDREVERYWMGPDPTRPGHPGGADLYVGGVEHAVLHLLYARFWHKVLFDLGHVSSSEPFYRLFNQGYILAAAFKDEREIYVDATAVTEQDGAYLYEGRPVTREFGKMGKSLKNAVTPDEMYDAYGADTLRIYEMSMGPMDASRPWETRAVPGAYRLLQRVWRNLVDEDSGELRVAPDGTTASEETARVLARTVDAVRADLDGLRFNTAIARITELNNHLTGVAAAGGISRDVAETLVLLLAPLAPHLAEELWERLGHASSLAFEAFPVADPALLVADTVEVPVQVNGKVRARVSVPTGADAAVLEAAARADARIAEQLAAVTVRKVITVPGKLVNFVVG
ncbi:MAG: leucine--tRNA ligase [Acidimicrobiales bacterium]